LRKQARDAKNFAALLTDTKQKNRAVAMVYPSLR
jgi:hypothetical protein